MEINTGQIEKLFAASDFSKETDLKERLAKKISATKKVSLDDLMEKEGMKKKEKTGETSGKRKTVQKQSQKTMKPPVM